MNLATALVLALPQTTAGAELGFHAAPRPLAKGAVVEASPGFLGAARKPETAEKPLLLSWPATGPKLVWERRSGAGYAAPAVVPGRLVYFHRIKAEEVVDCIDPDTGKLLWRKAQPVKYEDEFGFSGGPRCCPLIHRGRVYTYGVAGRLQCLKLGDGATVWSRDLKAELKIPQMFFGVGATPLIVGDELVVNVGAPGGPCVVGLDLNTGKRRWAAGKRWLASYASPIQARIAGEERILVFGGGKTRPPVGGLSVLSLAGELLWEFPWRSRKYFSVNAANPVVQGDQVFISDGYSVGGVMLRLDAKGRGAVVWKKPDFDLHFTTPVLHEGYLYGFAGEKELQCELVCVAWKTGEEMWRRQLRWDETVPGRRGPVELSSTPGRAFLMRADGGFLCLGERGHLLSLALSPKGVQVRARARLFLAPETWCPLVIHRGLLYVCQNERDFISRAAPRLLCYDLRGS